MSPHKDGGRDIISILLKGILQKVGVDTNSFISHGARMAATPKAVGLHVSVSTVIGITGLNRQCIFGKQKITMLNIYLAIDE